MPRVTFTTYCERRTKLRRTWQANRGDFSDLTPPEQWVLHEYYRFAESLTPNQVQEHWTDQQAKPSSRAQRAGRAYAAFEKVIASKPVPVQRAKHKLDKVKVESIVLPQPDTKKLARALLEVVRKELDSQ